MTGSEGHIGTPDIVAADEPQREVLRGNRFLDVPVAEDEGLDLTHNLIVRAGAGSGKTTVLIDRLIVLVRSGAPLSSLVAITFTNRAAGELRERFFARLLEVKELLEDRDGAQWEEEYRRVEEAIHRSDEAFIGTIHAFCLRLLRQRSFQAGLPPDFRQVEEADELTLRKVFWQSRLEEAHEHGNEDWQLLVRGGVSASGLFNFFGLLSNNQSVTFPAKGTARPDLEPAFARCRSVLSVLEPVIPPTDDPDAFMAAVQRARLRLEGGAEDAFRMAGVMKTLLEGVKGSDEPELDITFNRWDADRKSDLYGLAQDIKKGNDELLDGQPVREAILGPILEAVREWDAWLHEAALRFAGQAVDAYREYRLHRGWLTYDDLLHEATRLVLQSGSARSFFQSRYRHLLVDEFQDTDPAQAALLFGLCSKEPDVSDWTQSRLEPGRLFVVGDDKQSIYRFRKADFQVFSAVADAVVRDGGREIPLTANFRTDEALCQWINQAVGSIFAEETAPYQAQWENLDPARGRFGPEQPVVQLAIGKSGGRSQKPRVVAEAITIAEMIQRSVASGESGYGDHMILVRTHTNVPLFLDAFSRMGIPVALPGGKQRGADQVIRLIHDLLRCLYDPNDGVSLIAVLRGILFGISDTDLLAYRQAGGNWKHHLADSSSLDAAPSSIRQASLVLREWADLFRTRRPASAFEAFLAASGLHGALMAEPNAELGAGMLRRIGSLITDWDAQGYSLARCVKELGRYRSEELNLSPFSLDEPFGSCVRILTVHSAKGLQSKVVYLADCLPDSSHTVKLHIRRDGGALLGSAAVVRGSAFYESTELQPAGWAENVAEEKRFEQGEAMRLLYVAATRAKEKLVVSTHPEVGKGKGTWDLLTAAMSGPLVQRVEVDPPQLSLPDHAETEATADGMILGKPLSLPGPEWALWLPSDKSDAQTSDGRDAAHHASRTSDAMSDGMAYGSAVHTLFESIVSRRKEDFEANAIEAEAVQLMQARFEADKAARFSRSAGRAVARFVESDVWKALKQADRVLTEVPFTTQSLQEGLAIVTSGVVDLAFRAQGRWTIVDFKTDRADAETLVERHGLQIQAYVQAWTTLFPEETCEGLIWSTEEDRAIPVAHPE